MTTLMKLLLVVCAVGSVVAATPDTADALPWGCKAGYGSTIGEAYCTSPSTTGQVRVVGRCYNYVRDVTQTIVGPWVPSGGTRSRFACEWLGDPRWAYRATGAYYQIR